MVKLLLVVYLIVIWSTEVSGDICPDDVDITPIDETKPSVFQQLSALEINRVRDYLKTVPDLNYKAGPDGNVSDTFAYIIEKKPVPKDDVLAYVDGSGQVPKREARVALAAPTGMLEYTVGPLPNPTYHFKTKFPKWSRTELRFTDRPSAIDSIALTITIQREARKMTKILHESFNGFDFEDTCNDKCLTYFDMKLNVYQNRRLLWVNILRKVPLSVGSPLIHPLALQLLVDMTSSDPDKWNVGQVWYNEQRFDSVDDLVEKYNNDEVKKIRMSYDETDVYSSMRRRGNDNMKSTKRGPDCFPQDGRRYSVDGHRVKYMNWEFEFTYRQTTGPQLFDIRFNNTRIVYELSMQEVALSYTGKSPFSRHGNVFYDNVVLIGNFFSPLMPGVDCPKGASFFSTSHYSYKLAREVEIPNAFCLFEYTEGPPLRRHYDSDHHGGYYFYAGMPNNALVLRSIQSNYNYDYVFDFIFYQNGVIGTKIGASGYVMPEFANRKVPKENPFGFKIHENVRGMLHQHLFSFKVDLDIQGRKNRHETLAVVARPTVHKVVDGIEEDAHEQYLKRHLKHVEKDAAYRFKYKKPKFYLFYNNREKSKWGAKRAYYIDNQGVSKYLYPDDSTKTDSVAWAKYQLAVTRYHDDEDRSTSAYNTFHQADPVLNFDSYINDNENITDEDLVAWVSLGFQHVPNHSSDVPVTTTPGNIFSFYLKPFNYFDEDPSISSNDNVYVTPGKDGGIVVEENANNAKESCSHPNKDPRFVGDYVKPEF
ncbi:unnamed protein product [Owenia fusiformis]|uniref:Amine oxidase n=1 Tax=Owenia fusiformis TaxID=6347 RepID=A0A8J1XS06_OWEFU|nr:unnamed protein product [Owenia fusiformis]